MFNGRARRKEYWMFFLFNCIIVDALAFIEVLLRIGPPNRYPGVLYRIFFLAVLTPAVAVAVRRMHDTDHSGWWLLFPLVNFVFLVSEGQRGDNRFGPDPKI